MNLKWIFKVIKKSLTLSQNVTKFAGVAKCPCSGIYCSEISHVTRCPVARCTGARVLTDIKTF
jgi:hypothetical protein